MRIAVAGVSGAGKTTLCRRIAAELGLHHTEIDGLYHGPNWTPRVEFVADVTAILSRDEWVIEWQYREVRAHIVARAEVLVWLDLPALVTLHRVIQRTIRRRRTREKLWNGNREGPLSAFFTDPDHIIRWAIRTQWKLKKLVPEVAHANPHLRVIRLRNQREVDAWVRTLAASRQQL